MLILLLLLLLTAPGLHAEMLETSASDVAAPVVATYPEIPYYIRQLNETDVERKRIELNKIIHDAIVNADLSDKKVVKAMEPMIAKIRICMDSGLDRAYLEGESNWLQSAVDYFDREKLKPTLEIPESDWLSDQTSTSNGGRLNITPDKVWLINNNESSLVAESSNIHEAVIAPDAKKAAFVRESNDGSRAEIWTVNMKNRVRKKLTTTSSCLTLLLSANGDRFFFQDKATQANGESSVWSVSFSGGTPKKIAQVRLLQTVVAKGKYTGSLVVYKARRHHLGTTDQECAYALNESGRDIGRIKNIPCR